MTLTSRYIPSNSNPFSHYSTQAVSTESRQIRQLLNNEWYRAAFMQSGYEKTPTLIEVDVEPCSDYQSPGPVRSYNIKIRVVSKTKGQPVN